MSQHEKSEPRFVSVHASRMAYVELGTGRPLLFLHGNPTSSFLWRNIMPLLADAGRCIAPDLIGMGRSDKLPNSGPGRYRFVEHRRYLDGFIEALGIEEPLTLVIHDWGSALGFDWAHRFPNRVRAIAYMEGIVCPIPSWNHWPENARKIFQGMRSESGEAMVLERNVFIEKILPASIIRTLSDDEMSAYRQPFMTPGESRRPTLSWPRDIPIAGTPSDVVAIVDAYANWMKANHLPKLFVNADPGSILVGEMRDFCRTWHNQSEATVRGIHFIQEDSPVEIAHAIREWLPST